MSPIVQEAARYLLQFYFKRVQPAKVIQWLASHPQADVHSLIKRFFNDEHTYYDGTPEREFVRGLPKPRVNVVSTSKKTSIRMGPFVGIFGKTPFKRTYINAVQQALRDPDRSAKSLEIDLRDNSGGDDHVMVAAVRGADQLGWKTRTVLVNKKTVSAAAMLAAHLVFDQQFRRKGPRTSKTLSQLKNIKLSDGTFLGVTQGKYTTPGGKQMPHFWL